MILVGIIAAKSKPFVVHLNVLNYNNCPSIGRYLFVNPVRYIYIYIYRESPDEWATTKQACRDELVVYLFFFLPYIVRSTSMY